MVKKMRILMGLMLILCSDAYATGNHRQSGLNNNHEQGSLFRSLSDASAKGDLDEVKRLIDEVGVDVNIVIPGGVPALNTAVSHNQIKIVQFLLEKKATPNKKRAILNAKTPLQEAREKGYLEIVALLEKAGAQ